MCDRTETKPFVEDNFSIQPQELPTARDEYKICHWFLKVPFFIQLQCKSLLLYTSEIGNYSERLHPPRLCNHRPTTTICIRLSVMKFRLVYLCSEKNNCGSPWDPRSAIFGPDDHHPMYKHV